MNQMKTMGLPIILILIVLLTNIFQGALADDNKCDYFKSCKDTSDKCGNCGEIQLTCSYLIFHGQKELKCQPGPDHALYWGGKRRRRHLSSIIFYRDLSKASKSINQKR